MALPKRKYYTLEKAIKVISGDIDFSDLIHFASIGLLQLCVKAPDMGFYLFKDDEVINITIESNSILFLDKNTIDKSKEEIGNIIAKYESTPSKSIYPDDKFFHYQSDYLFISEEFDTPKDTNKVHILDGLVAIPYHLIAPDEIDIINGVADDFLIDSFDIPRCDNFTKSDGYEPSDYYLSDWFSVKVKDLLITDYELDILINGGRAVSIGIERDMFHQKNAKLEKKPTVRTTANQATYIKFLLLLNGFSEQQLKQSPQTLLDEISKRANAAKIEPPVISDKTLGDWLERARGIRTHS
ncbi:MULTISPECIES: hypothetical protein [Photorhabdus]|uniref:Uncharacterized protein n=1 Tax=Photorhabdus hindustanensis TaxID=2918802 RepID=A0A2S8Q8L2_9GAMM|nr:MULTISPECIES: hypothetical protein [Photorhabdus]MCC8456628.1 hypothetical protein [Photorhabdus aegyptia]PQQ29205.1 hypothetical protein C6H66_02725 [Photorhabdus hindustanensis]